MRRGFFITGTDTDVGKTSCALALMHHFKRQGMTVAGMKPVASGCKWTEQGLRNEDALMLQQHASMEFPYRLVNPYALELPVSPHLAVSEPAESVDFKVIKRSFDELKSKVDVLLVEGVGGWYAPVNNREAVADMAKSLNLPVIMVVSLKLGCINHARLTFEAIQSSGLECAGWIANLMQPDMQMQQENIATIKTLIDAPLAGVLPFSESIDFIDFAEKPEFKLVIR